MVGREPEVRFFIPHGIPQGQLDEIILTVDEYEALRLSDLEEMNQDEASVRMNISQSTYYRLLKSARNKVSDALINGKAIRIKGGDYELRPKGRNRGHNGDCVCPSCDTKVPHQTGIPCNEVKCPNCGKSMFRG